MCIWATNNEDLYYRSGQRALGKKDGVCLSPRLYNEQTFSRGPLTTLTTDQTRQPRQDG